MFNVHHHSHKSWVLHLTRGSKSGPGRYGICKLMMMMMDSSGGYEVGANLFVEEAGTEIRAPVTHHSKSQSTSPSEFHALAVSDDIIFITIAGYEYQHDNNIYSPTAGSPSHFSSDSGSNVSVFPHILDQEIPLLWLVSK